MSAPNDLGISPGFISGTAIIRDKDGKVKGEISLHQVLTPEQSRSLDEAIAEGQRARALASDSSL